MPEMTYFVDLAVSNDSDGKCTEQNRVYLANHISTSLLLCMVHLNDS